MLYFFCIIKMVINMTIYIDLLLILNFIYDFLLLMTVSVTLKRYISIKKLLFGSLFGMLTTLIILIPLNKYLLLLIKLLLGVLLCIITYNYKDIKYTLNNIVYLYMTSIILAGFLYFLNLEFGNKCYILSLLIGPLILYMYVKMMKNKSNISLYKRVLITFKNNKTIELNGFIDTGNNLIDPITNKRIIIINKNMLKGIYNIRSPMYVPCHTINSHNLLECISIKNIIVDNKIFNNYLLGLVDNLNIGNGVDCLINNKILEEL